MNLRTVTLGLDPDGREKRGVEQGVRDFFAAAEREVSGAGYALRSKRIVLPALNTRPRFSRANLNAVLTWLRDLAASVDVRWFNVPFGTFVDGDLRPHFDAALEVLQRYPNAFVNFSVAEGGRISREGVRHFGELVSKVARLSRNGYDNFRVGAACNGVAGTPFFPFSFHDGPDDAFALALEQPQVFLRIIRENAGADLEALRGALLAELVPAYARIDEVGRAIETATGVRYRGFDAALAPFPDETGSVARLVEVLGGMEGYGSAGTLFVTAFLTDVLRVAVERSGARSVGFNGVMASLLEDPCIGRNSDLKTLTLDSLLAYASVCGCGLDMVPIPGDTYVEEIASLVLDVAAMSCALRKPLGVRLLPIPSKRENEWTDFSHDFIYNCRVLGVRHRHAGAGLIGGAPFTLETPIPGVRR